MVRSGRPARAARRRRGRGRRRRCQAGLSSHGILPWIETELEYSRHEYRPAPQMTWPGGTTCPRWQTVSRPGPVSITRGWGLIRMFIRLGPSGRRSPISHAVSKNLCKSMCTGVFDSEQ